MTAANQGRVAPYGAVLGVSDPTAVRRQWIVRAAAVATVALACAACVGLLVHERGVSGEAAELGGAYYAVAKPPAFNFNREYPAIPQPCPVCAASRRSIRSRFQDPLNEGSPAAPLVGYSWTGEKMRWHRRATEPMKVAGFKCAVMQEGRRACLRGRDPWKRALRPPLPLGGNCRPAEKWKNRPSWSAS